MRDSSKAAGVQVEGRRDLSSFGGSVNRGREADLCGDL